MKLGVKLSCTSELPYKCAIERTICEISFKGLYRIEFQECKKKFQASFADLRR